MFVCLLSILHSTSALYSNDCLPGLFPFSWSLGDAFRESDPNPLPPSPSLTTDILVTSPSGSPPLMNPFVNPLLCSTPGAPPTMAWGPYPVKYPELLGPVVQS